jgi:glycosyltransferase involved in cell wall biosynthesis
VKIAWVAPLAAESAIARFSTHVASRLARGADVEYWTDSASPRHACDVPVVQWTHAAAAAERLRSADVVAYNIGDSLPFHGRILDLLERRPGIVILHDRVLHHMFVGRYLEQGGAAAYAEALHRQHGERAARVAKRALAWRISPWENDRFVDRYPLFGDAVAGATGVIVHSASHAAALRGVPVRVRQLYLPAYDVELPPPAPYDGGDPARPLRMVTVGWVNPNKHVDAVLRALGADPVLRERLRYDVLGPLNDSRGHATHLRTLIAELGLEDVVQLRGFVDEPTLRAELSAADIFVNLRAPAMEGASASLMESLEHGRPIVVYDTGVYAELPDDAVVKVPPRDDAALGRALRVLVDDRGRRVALARAARDCAERHTIEGYGRGFLDFVDEVRSTHVLREVVGEATATLTRWGAAAPAAGDFVRAGADGVGRAVTPLVSALAGREPR